MRKPLVSNNQVVIDASGKILGRLASQVAVVLRGKNLPSFRPDVISGPKVLVKNFSKMLVTGDKYKQKMYAHFSGYAGGLRQTSLGEKMKKDPKAVLMLAVKRMLPDNRTRNKILKRLTIQL
ncbi:MAG: 50S ribosomal protein L13 [Patescibacteria group bacterium]